MMWFLVIFPLHMLAAENVPGNIQVVKFTGAEVCEKMRSAMSTEGVMSACTSNQHDATGFVTAMNCHDPQTEQLPGGAGTAIHYTCNPYVSVPK
jgi:hypothetical protein